MPHPCTSCHTPVPDDAAFCPTCGAATPTQNSQEIGGTADASRAPTDPSGELAALQRALSGRFSVERELGRGGMGVVLLARDVALDRRVAIKLLPRVLAVDPESRARFLREARTAAALSHPNIVPIHLVEEKDELVYFVMAFIDGESLGERVRRGGPLKPADAAKLIREVAWALGYAHARGVIHRDIKPDNILIEGGSGRAMVTDFGIARVTTSQTVSQQGEVLGTLQYMSPEQAAADAEIDGRADLYSLGVTAFFALTGRLPFESQNPAALIAMHVAEPAPPLLSVSRSTPAKLAEAIDACLAKAPEDRPASGELLAEAISDAQVVHREIAPSVRAFLQSVRSSVVQVGALTLLWLWWGVWISELGTAPADAPLRSFIGLWASLAVLAPVLSARGVARAGLDAHDVAEAAASLHLDRDANVERALSRAERVRKSWLTRVIILVFSLPNFWMVLDALRSAGNLTAAEITFFLVTNGGIGVACLATAVDPGLVIGALEGGSPRFAGLLRWLWGGPVGRMLFAVSRLGLKRPRVVSAEPAGQTEILLGRAVGNLFEQLRRDQRTRLGDVPKIIARLESAAASLRARRDALGTALADVGSPSASPRRAELVAELGHAREAVEKRLATAVAALENLRLDLLRLRAGVAGADELTAAIEQARAVGDAVSAEIAATEAVDDLLHA